LTSSQNFALQDARRMVRKLALEEENKLNTIITKLQTETNLEIRLKLREEQDQLFADLREGSCVEKWFKYFPYVEDYFDYNNYVNKIMKEEEMNEDNMMDLLDRIGLMDYWAFLMTTNGVFAKKEENVKRENKNLQITKMYSQAPYVRRLPDFNFVLSCVCKCADVKNWIAKREKFSLDNPKQMIPLKIYFRYLTMPVRSGRKLFKRRLYREDISVHALGSPEAAANVIKSTYTMNAALVRQILKEEYVDYYNLIFGLRLITDDHAFCKEDDDGGLTDDLDGILDKVNWNFWKIILSYHSDVWKKFFNEEVQQIKFEKKIVGHQRVSKRKREEENGENEQIPKNKKIKAQNNTISINVNAE